MMETEFSMPEITSSKMESKRCPFTVPVPCLQGRTSSATRRGDPPVVEEKQKNTHSVVKRLENIAIQM